MAKQLNLIKEPRRDTKLWWIRQGSNYGGSLNYRKVERPFDSKKAVHVVFKAQVGQGIWLSKSQKSIANLIRLTANRYSIRIHHFAINKDHIHLLVTAKVREDLLCFLRLFSAEMGRKYKEIWQRFGLRKSHSLWLHRPFTRLVSRGKKSFLNVKKYIEQNRQEALGFISYQPRNHQLSKFLARWELAQLRYKESYPVSFG